MFGNLKSLYSCYILFFSGHIIIATPGRLEDLFQRKQDDFSLPASVKALVNFSLSYQV